MCIHYCACVFKSLEKVKQTSPVKATVHLGYILTSNKKPNISNFLWVIYITKQIFTARYGNTNHPLSTCHSPPHFSFQTSTSMLSFCGKHWCSIIFSNYTTRIICKSKTGRVWGKKTCIQTTVNYELKELQARKTNQAIVS